MNPPTDEHNLQFKQQLKKTYDRYPILVWAIVLTWVVIIVLSVGTAVAITSVQSNAARIEKNGIRSEQAICAIQDFAYDRAPKSPTAGSDLEDLGKRLGRLVNCVGPIPTDAQLHTP